MLQEKDIAIHLKCQSYECKTYTVNLEGTESVLIFESKQKTEDVLCPYCGGKVHICELTNKHLRDMPIWSGVSQDICFQCHRYRCVECGKKHAEDIPLQYPGTRITERAAKWIQTLLLNKVSIRNIQKITQIHWETIRNIHISSMEKTLEKHTEDLKVAGYHPQFLAVDEFAIHKGHEEGEQQGIQRSKHARSDIYAVEIKGGDGVEGFEGLFPHNDPQRRPQYDPDERQEGGIEANILFCLLHGKAVDH